MDSGLRIAQIAPVADAVRRDSTGSIEQLVYLLTEELVRRGHEVTLFATGDSESSSHLRSVFPCGYERDVSLWDWRFREMLHVATAFELAARFDVIHSHDYGYALPFTRLVDVPVVHTYHIMPNPDIIAGFRRYPEAHPVAISEYQRRAFVVGMEQPPGDDDVRAYDGGLPVHEVAVIHHGIDTGAFTFGSGPGDYLFFLGRLMAGKGMIEAIQVARAVSMPLVIAGPSEGDYFDAHIASLVDGHAVRYVGAVTPERRNRLLADAAALLYPLTTPEPFGLVMIEAMASGTPVAALNRGAVPEIVEVGLTGYHAEDVDGLVRRVPDVLNLDRSKVRQRAQERFDVRCMADRYQALYRSVVQPLRRKVAL